MRGDDERLALVARRAEMLKALTAGPLHKRDLIEELEVSRSTVDRAIDELTETDLVERINGGFAATLPGRLALDRYRSYVADSTAVLDAADVLRTLSADAAIEPPLLVDADVHRSEETVPYRPLEPLHAAIEAADRYKAVLPALADPRHLRLLYEHVVVDNNSAELVVSEDLQRTLTADFPRRLDAMAAAGGFELHVGDVPKFGLVLTEVDGDVSVSLVVFSSSGGATAVIRNDTGDAVAWAERWFEGRRTAAEPAQEQLRRNGGSRSVTTPRAAEPGDGEPLPVDLAATGFVRLSTDFFANEVVADPLTAWRAGLNLPEVYAGYAVDRTHETDAKQIPLTDELLDRLDAGAICALVGPPGSGKSTICRDVATAWYITGRGPVFYRRSGHGDRFDDPATLLDVLDEVDGHALVVVEDSVRPAARGILSRTRELDERANVSVLLDAREGEWRDPPGPRLPPEVDDARGDAIDVVPMPSLHEGDAAALVDHIERTVGRAVDVPADALLDGLDRHEVPGDVLLLIHRVLANVEGAEGDPTPLESEVRDLVEALHEASNSVLDIGVVTNILNAAGLPVDRPLLHAAAPGNDAAVDAALERLEGRVLFERDDPEDDRYRPVHEAWSTVFLAQLLDIEGETRARRRFGRCASGILALGENGPNPVQEVADGGESVGSAHPTGEAPATRGARLVEAVFGIGLRTPKLAPLFGPTDETAIDLPGTVGAETELRCIAWRGRMFEVHADIELAHDEFERLRERTPDPRAAVVDEEEARLHVEALLGLADVAVRRGEYDVVRAMARAARDAAEAIDRPALSVQADAREGRALRETGEYGQAASVIERGLETARAVGSRDAELECLLELGLTETYRREFDDAIAYKKQAYDLAKDLGDRERQQRAADDLGMDYSYLDELATADEWEGRALELARELGNRHAEAVILGNLASRDQMRGYHEEAARRLKGALEIAKSVEGESSAQIRLKLGVACLELGDIDTAVEHTETGLDEFRDRDMPRDVIFGSITLARAALARGDPVVAEEHARDALELSETLDGAPFKASLKRVLGQISLERGDLTEAEAHLGESLELSEDIDSDYKAGWAECELGALARAREDHETARRRLTSAAERLESVSAFNLAVEAIERLVEVCTAQGDADAAADWCARGLELATEHGFEEEAAWFRDRREQLDGLAR